MFPIAIGIGLLIGAQLLARSPLRYWAVFTENEEAKRFSRMVVLGLIRLFGIMCLLCGIAAVLR